VSKIFRVCGIQLGTGAWLEVVVEAVNLVKRFGSVMAVNGVSFKIEKGSIYSLLGPNGAGKTTTIKMLSTLLKPTSGDAYIAGFSVVREPLKVRRIIGLMPQDLTADDEMTGWDNVMIQARLYGYKGREAEERVKRALDTVGLLDVATRKVSTYSGGMRRRLEVAMSLVHDPEVLFLDEPTLGLDVQTRRVLWDLIRGFRRSGKTVLLTTHYMEEAEVLSDRVAIIDEGRIKAEGSPEELKSRIRGDMIRLELYTDIDVKGLAEELSRLGLNYRVDSNTLTISTYNAGETLPLIINMLAGKRVKSVNIVKPNLEEVFLEITGKRLREESFDVFKYRVLTQRIR
jgi:ABC-2 type transport system ATP-binding protein